MRLPPVPLPLHSPADPQAARAAARAWMPRGTLGEALESTGSTSGLPGSTPAALGAESTGLGATTADSPLADEATRERRRQQRIAERRAFVVLKGCFIEAAAEVPGTVGEALRRRVRATQEPIDLWHLHEVLIALLPDATSGHAQRIRDGMDVVFGPALAGMPIRPV